MADGSAKPFPHTSAPERLFREDKVRAEPDALVAGSLYFEAPNRTIDRIVRHSQTSLCCSRSPPPIPTGAVASDSFEAVERLPLEAEALAGAMWPGRPAVRTHGGEDGGHGACRRIPLLQRRGRRQWGVSPPAASA